MIECPPSSLNSLSDGGWVKAPRSSVFINSRFGAFIFDQASALDCLSRRDCERISDVPTGIEPSPQRARGYADLPRPLEHGFDFSRMCQMDIVSAVQALLRIARPSAVFGAVGAIVIGAIKCAALHPFRFHIGKKLPDVAPLITDKNTPPSISRIGCVSRVVAAVNHPAPSREQPVLAQAVRRHASGRHLISQTPTRKRLASFKFVASNNFFSPAVTNAIKHRMSAIARVTEANNGPSPKPLTVNALMKFTMCHGEIYA